MLKKNRLTSGINQTNIPIQAEHRRRVWDALKDHSRDRQLELFNDR